MPTPPDKTKRTIHPQSFDQPEFWVGNFAEFAQELGYVTWAWNALHADLCDLFWIVTGIESPDIPRGIWHAIKSDTGQRDVLKGAAIASSIDQECRDDIVWLVREIGHLAAFRNDATHTLWTTEPNANADPTNPDF